VAIKVFEQFGGHSWKKKFGWTGQTKSSVRPLVKTYEAEAGLYDGVQTSRLVSRGVGQLFTYCMCVCACVV
jgi:hypothetical protein